MKKNAVFPMLQREYEVAEDLTEQCVVSPDNRYALLCNPDLEEYQVLYTTTQIVRTISYESYMRLRNFFAELEAA